MALGKKAEVPKQQDTENLKTEAEYFEQISQEAVKTVALLLQHELIVTAVESCTGGMVAAALTSVPGSSAVLHESRVTYCDEAKREMVGVRKKTLKKHTAVSKKAAAEMALGGYFASDAMCSVSVTGYAGPDSGNGEPVGLVYIGCCVDGEVKVKKFQFEGDRAQVRAQACEEALKLLQKRIKKAYE